MLNLKPKPAVGRPHGASEALEMSLSRSSFDSSSESILRSMIRDAADQLCQVVDGDLDFVVRTAKSDDDIDRLLLLVNFVLAAARRSFNDLREVNLRMEEELAAARKLQEKLLPQTLPPADRIRVAARCVPARSVGGDFFDFFRYPKSGRYIGVLADVSGKGPAAAIYAALASGFVRSLVQEELNPKSMLERLNTNLFNRAPDGQYVALTYCTWDDENRIFEICGSGLPEPLLCRNGQVTSLPVHGLPLGLFANAEYESLSFQCEPGDTLLFYTDGAVEARDPDGNELGLERLGKVLLDSQHYRASEIVKKVVEEATDHCQCEFNFDDQTVVAVKVL